MDLSPLDRLVAVWRTLAAEVDGWVGETYLERADELEAALSTIRAEGTERAEGVDGAGSGLVGSAAPRSYPVRTDTTGAPSARTTIDEAFETVRVTVKAWEPLAQIELQASPALAALDLIRKRIEELEGALERAVDLTKDWNHPNADEIAALSAPSKEE